jgi:uncharacterized membrane protein YbhN (UPF0104 family)
MDSPTTTSTSARRLRLALRGGALVIVASGIVVAVRHLDLSALRLALHQATLWPLLLAMALNLGPRTLVRARKALVILRAARRGEIPLRRLFPLLLAGWAAGYLVVAPAEEILYTGVLTRHGFRLRELISLQLLDKVLGVLSVLLVTVPAVPLSAPWRLALEAAVVLATAAVVIVGVRTGALPWPRALEALAWLVVSNLLSVVMLWLCARAVGLDLGPWACLRIFATTSTACALPVTPGQLGVLEAAFVFAAHRLGVPTSTALAAALLYHAAHVAPLVAAGLPPMIRLLVAKRAHPPVIRSPDACISPP